MNRERNNQYSVAIVGPEAVVSGFKMLGVQVFSASDSSELFDMFMNLKNKDVDGVGGERYACVIVMEDLMEGISEEEYARMTRDPLPALVVLPGTKGSSGQSGERLKALTQRAIGTDIS